MRQTGGVGSPPPPKTPELLTEMLDHVHYEVQQLLLFAARGNRNETEQIVRISLLEAGLLHIRCVIEFLGQKKGDRVAARDYVPGWTWLPDRNLMRMNQLDGRLAHLGLVRATPVTAGTNGWPSSYQRSCLPSRSGWWRSETPRPIGTTTFRQPARTGSRSRQGRSTPRFSSARR